MGQAVQSLMKEEKLQMQLALRCVGCVAGYVGFLSNTHQGGYFSIRLGYICCIKCTSVQYSVVPKVWPTKQSIYHTNTIFLEFLVPRFFYFSVQLSPPLCFTVTCTFLTADHISLRGHWSLLFALSLSPFVSPSPYTILVELTIFTTKRTPRSTPTQL